NISVEMGLCNGSRGVAESFRGPLKHPVVKFTSGKSHVIEPETWTVRVGAQVLASRTQVPLELAWAVSVHKSQGMSLGRAHISLQNVFEYGQAYVALSRVRSLEGLLLTGFSKSKVMAHEKVLAFYRGLEEGSAGDAAADGAASSRSSSSSE